MEPALREAVARRRPRVARSPSRASWTTARRRWRRSTSRSTCRSSPTACRAWSSSTWPRARPLIASRVGVVPEVLRTASTRLLVPAGDPAALAAALAAPARRRRPAARGWREAGAGSSSSATPGARLADVARVLLHAPDRAREDLDPCFDLSDNATGAPTCSRACWRRAGTWRSSGRASARASGRRSPAGRSCIARCRWRARAIRASPRRGRARARRPTAICSTPPSRARPATAPRFSLAAGARGRCCSTSTTGRSASSAARMPGARSGGRSTSAIRTDLPWTWLMERLVPRADALTVASRFLERRFGGTLIPHVRDTEAWDPARFDRDGGARRARRGRRAGRDVPRHAARPQGRGRSGRRGRRASAATTRLVVVGADAASAAGRRWSAHPWVRLVGEIPFERVPQHLIAADVVAVPQRDTSDTRGPGAGQALRRHGAGSADRLDAPCP